MAEALDADLTGVVVPKVESADDVAAIVDALACRPCFGLGILVGVESRRGAAGRGGAATARPVVLLRRGGLTSPTWAACARLPIGSAVRAVQVALAARLGGVHAVDQIVADFRDDGRYVRRGRRGSRARATAASSASTPRRCPSARGVHAVGPAVDHARRLLAAYEEAATRGEATIEFEGEMVDEPMAAPGPGRTAAADDA